MDRPLILLSNDDGAEARGLLTLRAALRRLGRVVTIAPARQQSAKSHALTLADPLRIRTLGEDHYALDGTPADCVYVALYGKRYLDRMPDVVVSGINHGANLGLDVYYSGTVAAAREGAMRGLRAVAFSLQPRGDFEAAAEVSAGIVEATLQTQPSHPDDPHEAHRGRLLNVNFPAKAPYAGLRATCLGRRVYADDVSSRLDPRGREYLWIGGSSFHHPHLEGSDTEAVDAGYVSITPVILDATDAEGLGAAAFVAGHAARGGGLGRALDPEQVREPQSDEPQSEE